MRAATLVTMLAGLSIGVLPRSVLARNVSVSVPMSAIEARSGDRGTYYVATFDIPADVVGKRLDSVFLDFVVDASPTLDAVEGAEPFVSVCPLKEQFSGLSPSFEARTPSMRPVPMGENHKVRMDVTEIVKGWIESPSSRHGIVIGALTGPKVGTIVMKSDALAAGTALRVTFYYQNRSGGPVSAK